MARPAAVLFDLDGTLVDSAPDLAGTANDMRARRGLAPLPFGQLRPHAGSGARGMLSAAFELRPGHAGYEALRDEFHQLYELRMTRESALFAAIEGLLSALERQGLPWGIVTNKSLRFAVPMVAALPPLARHAVLIGGDSTPHTKPHPAPLLAAASHLGFDARACVYIGDDPRDMRAARAAGMAAWAAAWGYLGVELPVADWGADAVARQPNELLTLLDLP